MKIWAMMLAVLMLFAGADAQAARRLGGGKSVGQQSSQVSQRDAAKSPTPPAQNAKPAAPAAPVPPPVAPKRPWGAMLGGLAAGLGLAWLAHSLGLGEAFGNILLIGLLALGVMMVVGWFMRRGRPATSGQPPAYGYQGAGTAPSNSTYRPENVGNDASARPWERTQASFESSMQGSGATAGVSMIGSALTGSQAWGVPADFDVQGFLNAAKSNFVTLQTAWDASDTQTLRAMMTDQMLAEIKSQLAERDAQAGAHGQKTAVDMLKAELLGIEDRLSDYLASVEFSGVTTEDVSVGPTPFREVWNMTKPKDGSSGWLVAGVQALQ